VGVAPHDDEWTSHPSPWQAGVFLWRQTVSIRAAAVKKAANPAHLLSRDTPWLSWWQELILNWVSSWESIGCLTVSHPTDDDLWMAWDLPSDLDLQRMELEELLSVGEG
jgi:hypothetical protein